MKNRIGPLLLTGFFVGFALLYLVHSLRPGQLHPELDLNRFNELPVQEGGRLKPLDTIARNTLMVIAGRQSYRDAEDKRIPAGAWLAELMLDAQAAADRRVFRIDHPDIVGLLGEHFDERQYFSLRELAPHLNTLHQQFNLVNSEPARRSPYEKALVKLRDAIYLYDNTAYALMPPPAFGSVETDYLTIGRLAADRASAEAGSQTAETVQLAQRLLADQYRPLTTLSVRSIPPEDPRATDAWMPIGETLLAGLESGEIDPIAANYARLASAYQAENAAAFSQILDAQFSALTPRLPQGYDQTLAFETFFNRFDPFSYAMAVYVLVFLAAALGWLVWPRWLLPTALGLLLLAFVVHSFGMWARMDIQGRPPVTNLYSSAIFVGWGAVFLCAIIEAIFRNGIAAASAALIGFPTLVIAFHLSKTGDTLEMMRAVLDDNFWLATHVPTVTIGYSATFLAGALAIIYILRERLLGGMPAHTGRSIERMVYGAICFATLFSFVGTVLGGIWADQSWGRFWGWDPKENGALMIVLWNALILHARWGKVVSVTGLMQFAIVGNIITAWSWFGTNMLGVGLHSYGFMDSAFFWLLAFIASQVLMIILGWIPVLNSGTGASNRQTASGKNPA